MQPHNTTEERACSTDPQISGEREKDTVLSCYHISLWCKGSDLNQIEDEGFLLRSKCYLALGRLEVAQAPGPTILLCNHYFII